MSDDQDGADLGAIQDGSDENQPQNGSGSNENAPNVGTGGSGGGGGPYYREKFVVSCDTNTVDNPGNVLCTAAIRTCPDGELRYRRYVREVDARNRPLSDWEFTGTVCRGQDEPTNVPPQVSTEMVRNRAQALAPETVVHAEPESASPGGPAGGPIRLGGGRSA